MKCFRDTQNFGLNHTFHFCCTIILPKMLPAYDPNDNEDGVRLLESLTTNAGEIQQQVLREILTRNGQTEYLKRFLNGRCDEKCFKEKVPVVSYENIKPYIERIANGEPSQIISAQPITELLTRYGTKFFFFLFLFLF